MGRFTVIPLTPARPSFFAKALVLLAFTASVSLVAQTVPTALEPFESTGPIPAEFLQPVVQTYQEHLARHADLSSEQAEFYLMNAYQVQQLLSSGKVLFEDDASLYVQQVADQILRNRPDLRKDLRFFTVKSPELNAFSTNQGLILVNLGLLAHLQHEAQLAFILCHEISHYLRQHPLDIYLQGLENNDGLPVVLGGEQAARLRTRYTQEKELEADRLGWELFLEAGYDPAAGLEAFDLLLRAGQPFHDRPFDLKWLSISEIGFPATYDLANREEDQPLLSQERPSTHPEPAKRREILLALMDLQRPEPGRYTFLDRQAFLQVRDRARMEVIRMQLMNREYEQALYHTWCMEEELAGAPELQRTKAVALYALAKYATAGKFWDVHQAYSLVEGKAKALHYLLEQLQPEELSAIALHHTWKIHRAYPDDDALRLMCRDLMELLSQQYIESLDAEDSTLDIGQAIFFPAMLEMMQDSAFAKDIGSIMIRRRQMQDLLLTPLLREQPAPEPDLHLIGLHMGLDKVVWVDPFYQVHRTKDRAAGQLIESDEKEAMLTTLLDSFSLDIGLAYNLLSSHSLDSNDLMQFKALSLLQSWVEERTMHEKIDLISPVHQEVKELAIQYGTPYFVWVGCLAQQSRRKGKAIMATAGLLLPPLLPYSVWYLLTPRSETLIYVMVWNVETGTYEVVFPRTIQLKDRSDVIRAAVYDLVLQLQQPGP